MRRIRRGNRIGFTLIELSLSIAFIGILSIIVVVLINNAVTSYHRGIIMNEINTVGMDLVEDMRLSVQNSEAKPLINGCDDLYVDNADQLKSCKDDGAKSFASIVRYGKVSVGKKSAVKTPIYGAFCTGNYSYVWNSGYLFQTAEESKINGRDDKNTLALKYKINGGDEETKSGFRLLKVRDEGRWVCKAGVTKNNTSKVYRNMTAMEEYLDTTIIITDHPIGEAPKDVLADESGLAMYDLTAAVTAGESNRNMFYSATFILGTVRGGINIMTSGDYCTPPGDATNYTIEAFNYCAINKFNFAAMATGG